MNISHVYNLKPKDLYRVVTGCYSYRYRILVLRLVKGCRDIAFLILYMNPDWVQAHDDTNDDRSLVNRQFFKYKFYYYPKAPIHYCRISKDHVCSKWGLLKWLKSDLWKMFECVWDEDDFEDPDAEKGWYNAQIQRLMDSRNCIACIKNHPENASMKHFCEQMYSQWLFESVNWDGLAAYLQAGGMIPNVF